MPNQPSKPFIYRDARKGVRVHGQGADSGWQKDEPAARKAFAADKADKAKPKSTAK